MKLTENQLAAVDMIETATSPVRLLGGPGVGKSTTLDRISGDILKIAPTNKAAMLIGGVTIHKLLGLRLKRKGGKYITVPSRSTPRSPLPYRVAIDESSCIPRAILNKYVKPLIPRAIYVGDQAQLNPIGEDTIPFMDLDIPTIELDYVHRFGGELLEVAYEMRKCVFDSSLDFKVPMHWGCDQDELLHSLQDDDVVVAWRNKTVNEYNLLIKMHKFGTTDWQVGEKVRVGSYFEKLKLPTESEHFITSISSGHTHGMRRWNLQLNSGVVVPVVHNEDMEEFKERTDALAAIQDWRHFYALKDAFCDLRPSYAITAHKSQGSTYGNTFVDYTDIFKNENSNEAVRAAYVGTTRSSFKTRSIAL